MYFKDHGESCCSQGGNILFFPLKLLHDIVSVLVLLTQNQKWVKIMLEWLWSDFNACAFLHALQPQNATCDSCRLVLWYKEPEIFFGYSEICGVNFLNVLLAQHLSSRFSLLFLRLNLLKQCLPTKGNDKKQRGGFRSYYSLMQLKACSHKDQLF